MNSKHPAGRLRAFRWRCRQRFDRGGATSRWLDRRWQRKSPRTRIAVRVRSLGRTADAGRRSPRAPTGDRAWTGEPPHRRQCRAGGDQPRRCAHPRQRRRPSDRPAGGRRRPRRLFRHAAHQGHRGRDARRGHCRRVVGNRRQLRVQPRLLRIDAPPRQQPGRPFAAASFTCPCCRADSRRAHAGEAGMALDTMVQAVRIALHRVAGAYRPSDRGERD